MINAISEQFNRFVDFAEAQIVKGKDKAIAAKSDVAVRAGTTLEERNISVTDKTDWVGLVLFRGGDTKRANNEVRDMFKKTIADMFGGEKNIPDSVKEAMLLKDYGCGKPLTARRIIAVRNAIMGLNRVNCFDKTYDPNGQLAAKAITAGYTRLDFGKLNTAANLLAKSANIGYPEAMERILAEGSPAPSVMRAGSIYMKSPEDFAKGWNVHSRIVQGDAQNIELAKQNATVGATANLSMIADNLAYKYENILRDAELMLQNTGLKPDLLDKLKAEVAAVAKMFKDVAGQLSSGALKDRKDVYDNLFYRGLNKMKAEVEKVVRSLVAPGKNDASIEEFRQCLFSQFKEEGEVRDNLARVYKEAVAHDMAKDVKPRLIAAAQTGGQANNSPSDIPERIMGNIDNFLAESPFDRIGKLETFIVNLEKHGSASLRFTGEQKAELKALVNKFFGEGPEADKVFKRLIDQFESTFFANQLLSGTDFSKEPPKGQAFVVNFFKSRPEMLGTFAPGFKLGTNDEVAALKKAIKDGMVQDLNNCLHKDDPKSVLNLSSGLMPQAVREYNVGYVRFKGNNLPNAELGTNFPQLGSDCKTPSRLGYAEFLEKTFGDGYKKMRQTVSYVCGMANGLCGTIEGMIDFGNDCIKGLPRTVLSQADQNQFMYISAGERSNEDHYNIDIADNGDVKITLTHHIQSHVSMLMDTTNAENPVYNTKLIDHSKACAILGDTKVTVSMTIKNASDAQLAGDAMPQFTIDEIHQEMM